MHTKPITILSLALLAASVSSASTVLYRSTTHGLQFVAIPPTSSSPVSQQLYRREPKKRSSRTSSKTASSSLSKNQQKKPTKQQKNEGLKQVKENTTADRSTSTLLEKQIPTNINASEKKESKFKKAMTKAGEHMGTVGTVVGSGMAAFGSQLLNSGANINIGDKQFGFNQNEGFKLAMPGKDGTPPAVSTNSFSNGMDGSAWAAGADVGSFGAGSDNNLYGSESSYGSSEYEQSGAAGRI